ncbi:Ribosomal protein S5 domain 2-type fold [Amanita muscaria]
MNLTLDSFVKSSRPPPEPVLTSQEVRDRGSLFVAHLYRASSVVEAQKCIKHLKHVVHGSKRATHEIAAWRCMVLKPGSTGLSGPDDFELKSGYDEDGEQWAGNRVLKVMQNHSVIDAVVIVSRWYGGILLGPARFTHIEICTEEVCRGFKRTEELRDCITTLTSLDDLLAHLRSQLNKGANSSGFSESSRFPSTDYSHVDLSKAKRLIAARENSIKSCKNLLAKQPSPT